MMSGRERIGIKLLIINTKENNIEKWGFYQKGTRAKKKY